MNFKKEIRKLLQAGMEPKEAYKKFEPQVKSEAEKEELALIVAKTPIKSKNANIFNYFYLAIIVIATFFEIYFLFSSEDLKNALQIGFNQRINQGDETLKNVNFADYIHVIRVYLSLMMALITGVLTFFFVRKNLIVYRLLFITNSLYAVLFTIGLIITMVKSGITFSGLLNCFLCYLLVYLNYRIIQLYFPYLNVVAGLKKDKAKTILIKN